MKNYGLELIKIIAIFFVICSHVSPYYMQKLPDDFGMYLLSETGMLGVILFFSVSGFFILNNQRIDQFSYIFQKIKNTSRIFIIWVIIYFLFDKYIVSTTTQIKQVSLWHYLDVLSCFSEASPLWFLLGIIGLYVLVPLIRPAFTESQVNIIGKSLVLILIIANLTIVEKVLNHFFGVPFFVTPSLLTSTQVIGLFNFLLGGYLGLLHRSGKINTSAYQMILLALLTWFRMCWGHDYYFMKFYIFLLQPVCLFLFYFLVNLKVTNKYWVSFMDKVGDKVFGIYLVHNLFVIEIHPEVLQGAIAPWFSFLSPYVYTLLYSLAVLTISYVVCSILSRIKYVNTIIRL